VSNQDIDDRREKKFGAVPKSPTAQDIRNKANLGPVHLEQQVYMLDGTVESADGCDANFRKNWAASNEMNGILPDTAG
jgi:hypothetical protein